MIRRPFLAMIPIITLATGWALQSTDQVIFDNSIKNWVVDRLAGNTKAGPVFYQGSAREVGGLQCPEAVVETPGGVYIAAHEEGADNPYLYIVKNGMLRIVMDREGAIEGPIELAQGGYPVWNSYDNTLYLTGPYCIRKVTTNPDGTSSVAVVAGTPNVPGSMNGPALSATLQRGMGIAATQDGALYWLESKALRRLMNGAVSTVPLTRPETPGHLWNLATYNSHLLSAGENAHTLYVSNYYDTAHGYSILKVDLNANRVTRVIGVSPSQPNHGNEIDGQATDTAAFRGGARGIYHPGYDAIFLDGADPQRYRWWKRSGDNIVRTIFGTLRPGTTAQPFGITQLNSLGMTGEQFRVNPSSITKFHGVGSNGGVYFGAVYELSGIWRAYDNTVGSSISPIGSPEIGGNSRIYAAFVNSSGQVTRVPIEVSPNSTGVQANPKVAYCNGMYLVVWTDLRNETNFEVLGVRISSNGKVLDASPLRIGTGARTHSNPDVAADDQGFMVAWGGFQNSEIFPRVFAARIDANGTIGSASPIADGASPQIAYNSYERKYLVVYASAHNSYYSPTINYLIMDKSQNVSSATIANPWFYGSRNVTHFSVCSIPSAEKGWTFLMDRQSPNPWNRSLGWQRAINITPTGGIPSDSPSIPPWYESDNPPRGNWLDWNGLTPKEWPFGSNALAADGQGCVAVWNRYHVGGITGISLYDADLYVSRIDRWDPVETSPVALATSAVSERNPSLAGNGNGQLVVVYEKLAEGNPQIVARPLTITSKISVGTEVPIMATRGTQRGFPDIAYGGSEYMVVWQEGWYGEFLLSQTADNTPPIRTNGNPFGSIPSNSTQAELSLSTNEVATCRYSTTANTAYASMPGAFSSAASIGHRTTLTGLAAGNTYRYYVRCQDTHGNQNGEDFVISFATTATLDTAAPVLSDGSPSGNLPAGTTQTTISLSTNESATCRYAISPNIVFASMENSFSSSGTPSHSVTVSGLGNGGTYSYYVRCSDAAGNTNASDFVITFRIQAQTTLSSPTNLRLVTVPKGDLIQDGSTPEQLGLFLRGDNFSTSATASMRYKQTGTGIWTTGHSLHRIQPEYAAYLSQIDNGFAWTITGLSPGMSYDVEVTTHDNGVDDIYTATMSTRSLPAEAGEPTKVVTAGSTTSQIQNVFNSAIPGDVIQIANGTYSVDNLKITLSGTATRPIYFRGESRSGVILQDATGKVLNLDKVSHVIIENMTLQGSGLDSGGAASSIGLTHWGGYTGSPAREDITIRNLTITGVDRGILFETAVNHALVYDNTVSGNNSWTQDLYPYGGTGAPGAGDGTPDVDQNLFWNDDGIGVTGTGIAVFNNTVTGFGDALTMAHGNKQAGIHFYRNEVRSAGDDGFEADYGVRNITFYDNRITNAMTLISCDPCLGGPILAFRNIGINIGRQSYKLNNTNTGMFFFNNTIVRTHNPKQADWAWGQPHNGSGLRSWGFQNNITILQVPAGSMLAMEPPGQNPLDFTHNSWYPGGRVWWTKSGGAFSSLSAAYSSLPATTPVFSGSTRRHDSDNISEINPFVAAITLGYDHHTEITTGYVPILAAGTAPKNSGTPIIGVTDGFSGPAPDRGAIISGRPIPKWGDRSSLF